jgi:hypothetical protein
MKEGRLMTPTEARTWIIKASLLVYGCVFVFFVIAPALQYPLKYADAINVMKIIVPIFASYLGAATLFVISGQELEDTEPRSEMLGVLAKWPVVLFGIALVALLVGFLLSNRSEYNGEGMTPNVLSLLVSILSGLLAGTTGAISSYLFKVEKSGRRRT